MKLSLRIKLNDSPLKGLITTLIKNGEINPFYEVLTKKYLFSSLNIYIMTF